jgi:hypothetical protein
MILADQPLGPPLLWRRNGGNRGWRPAHGSPAVRGIAPARRRSGPRSRRSQRSFPDRGRSRARPTSPIRTSPSGTASRCRQNHPASAQASRRCLRAGRASGRPRQRREIGHFIDCVRHPLARIRQEMNRAPIQPVSGCGAARGCEPNILLCMGLFSMFLYEALRRVVVVGPPCVRAAPPSPWPGAWSRH